MAAPTSQNEVTARKLSDTISGLWGKIKDTFAPKASPAFTGTPTAPTATAGTNTTQIATTAFVKTATTDMLAEADAMIYKGTVAGGSTGSYGALTPAADKGHTYKVTTAGKIDGVAVEVGDMLICNTDSTAAATSSNYSTIAANWDFVQTNLDGVVIGPSSVTSGRVAAFDGTTGKLIKDSGYTIEKSVPSNAVFTDTDTKVKATAKTDNVNYKILATASSSPTSGGATEAVYDTDITLNPSTNTIAANISGTAGSVGSLLYAFKPGSFAYGYTHLFTVDYGTVKRGMCTFRVNASRGISVVVSIDATISRTDGGSTKAWMTVRGETEATTGYFKLAYKAASDSTTDRPKYEVWLIDAGASGSAERRVGVEVVKTDIATISTGNNSTTTFPDGLADFTYASISGTAATTHTHSVKINGATKTIAASGGTAVDLDYHPTARAVTATTVKNTIQELRVLPGGSVGSVQLAADNTVENVIIPAGWYNYIWTPHRAGASGGDHQSYGSLILMSMTNASPQTFVVEGANLADSSPVYRCRLLSQVAAMGSAYFGSNAKYRKIGTLSGPSSTGDACATFLVCIDGANVAKQAGILNVDIRNTSGTYTFNISLTELTGAASWTNKLKLYKGGGNLYIYGFGQSGAYYSVEVTPLAISDLTGTQVPGMWTPDTSNTNEDSVSYTAITYNTTQYVAKSSTSGVLMNDGSVTTKNYGGASASGKTYYVMGAEESSAGWKDTKMLAGIRTYNDSNNGHILYIGNTSGTGGTVDKGRVYLATGGGYIARIAPNTGINAHRDYYLPKTTETTNLVGASSSGVGSSSQPIYVTSDGVAAIADAIKSLVDATTDTAGWAVEAGWHGQSVAAVSPTGTIKRSSAANWTTDTNIDTKYLAAVVCDYDATTGRVSTDRPIIKEVDSANVTVGNSVKWGGYSIAVGSTSTASNTISFLFT